MIPRSILISIVAVAVIYVAINLSIIGVVPWREFVPADAHPESEFIVSSFMERLYGPQVATVFTFLILWTAFGSVFALLLGYSRIPYAAARDGYFFAVFGRLHPTKQFPHISLIVLGLIATVCALLPLGLVIDALITTRILVQFMGQVFAVMLLRARRPDMPQAVPHVALSRAGADRARGVDVSAADVGLVPDCAWDWARWCLASASSCGRGRPDAGHGDRIAEPSLSTPNVIG